jgi:hypothetical protein
MVDCKVCKTPFATPVQMDEATFKTGTSGIENVGFQCPQGHQASYDTADLYWL